MSDFKKLEIGEKASFRVRTVAIESSGKWPDYAFSTENGPTYTAPKAAIDRQLKRLNLEAVQLAGNVIVLERAPNKEDASKSWWNLSIGADSDLKAPAPSKRLTSEAAAGSKVPGEAPPAYHRDVPPPADEDAPFLGGLDGPEGDCGSDALSMPMRAKRDIYFALARDVAAFQAELSKQHDFPIDGSSVQAMTFSIFNGR